MTLYYKVPYDCFLLYSNFKEIWDYHDIRETDTLIVLGPLNFGTEIALKPNSPDFVQSVSMVASECSNNILYHDPNIDFDLYDTLLDQALAEHKLNQQVIGFEILSLKSMRKCWISHYDFKLLKEIS